jgi:hypothetical protein
MKFTIEEVLEMSVKHVQDTWRNEEQQKRAYEDLLHVCAGIVAGIKSIKQEKQDDDTLSGSSEAE